MKQLHILSSLLMAGLMTLSLSSCRGDQKKQTPDQDPDAHHYAYIAHGEKSYMITTFKDFTPGTVTDFKDAFTLPEGHACFEVYGDHLYAMAGSMMGFGGEQTLHKYSIDKQGRLKEVGKLPFRNSPNVVEVTFASEEKAYGMTSCSKGQIVIFNPKTMKETGSIDLSKYGKGVIVDPKTQKVLGEDHDPDAGTSIIRDGKLFVPLTQLNGMAPAQGEPATLAVIDVATDKVEKIITDKRVNALGMIGHSSPVLDDEGNLYFYTGPIAAMMEGMGMPVREGMLRIKKGETDFDKDYCLHLTGLEESEKGAFGMQMINGGNGKIYLFLNRPSKMVNPEDQGDPRNKSYFPYEIDLKTGKGRILPLKPSTGWAANALIRVGDMIYFGVQSETGTGFIGYNTKTGKGEEKISVKTPAGPYKVVRIK